MAADERVSTAHGKGTTSSARSRWIVLGLLLGVLVAGLVVSATIVFARGAGPGLGDRISSISDPPADATKDREKALAAARAFAQRFNTYGPDLLDSNGKMPDYAAIGDLMTAKFADVFKDNVGYAEQVVVETKIDRKGQVYAVGVSAIDQDSATLLVGGIVEFSYPDPNDASERVPFAPLRFRYEVSLVKQDGRWLVDDFDDIDDDLPSFADSADAPVGAPTDAPPSGAPSTDAPSSDAPTTPAPSSSTGAPEGGTTP